MRTCPLALVVSLVLLCTASCADEDFTRDVEARWCELVADGCAPPPPLQPPVLNQPSDAFRPSGHVYQIPPVYTPPVVDGVPGP